MALIKGSISFPGCVSLSPDINTREARVLWEQAGSLVSKIWKSVQVTIRMRIE